METARRMGRFVVPSFPFFSRLAFPSTLNLRLAFAKISLYRYNANSKVFLYAYS